ncbi:MAG TPA: metallophosphoesterase [Fervidobacterium sp.]|nr:metallophosphoesterase [Fervidobacterium sp.]
MSNTFFIGDLHLGHKKILGFSPQRGGTNIEEHDEWIISQWNSVVQKNDMVWVLGDVAFSGEALKLVDRLRGYKRLVRGNHDTQSTEAYLKYFNNVFGIVKENGMWLSHAPVHPQELRGKINVHGHVHHNSIRFEDGGLDPRYINVSVENINGIPLSMEDLRKKLKGE